MSKHQKTPDQVLTEQLKGERSIQDTGNPEQKVSVNQLGHLHISCNPDLIADIRAFHEKFKIPGPGKPMLLPDNKISEFRMLRLSEEFRELVDAYNMRQSIEFLDALVDLTYIVLGTAHVMGWDFGEAWRRVHAANMKKELANPKNPGRFSCPQDVVKPIGWESPRLNDLVGLP